ncbi:MAG: ABC transporter ATP-binding protein [Calditrichia bacterium]
MNEPAVVTQNLTKYYQRGKIKALQELNLSVERGSIFSLLGPNGAGKTTLIKLLLGIAFPTAGTATLMGFPIRKREARRLIGYLPENHRFPPFLNARETLRIYGAMSGLSGKKLEKRSRELLEWVGLWERRKDKISAYSKGMLQRLGLAQALLADPQLLFLDEPTDGIDPIGRKQIRDYLLQLKQEGKTIFLNSHLLSEVERVSDEIAVLNNGRLIAKGPLEQFIKKENIYLVRTNAPAPVLEKLAAPFNIKVLSENGHLQLITPGEKELNNFIDALRKEKFLLKALIPHKISLEDFFIETIEENK